MIKILAGVPCYNSVQPEPFLNFLTFSQRTGIAESNGLYSVRWCVPGPRMKTVTARNILSALAIEGKADYLLLIDDDMVVPKNLLDSLLRRNVPIVSPIFFRATPPIDPLVYDLAPPGYRLPYYDYPKNALFETGGGNGTGVMLIATEVLMAMTDPIWVGSTDPDIGEDIVFCDRARSLGYKSYCDSTIEARQMSSPVAIGAAHYDETRLTR